MPFDTDGNTPSVAILEAFAREVRFTKDANGPALVQMWERAAKEASKAEEEDEFSQDQRRQLDAVQERLQSEESRDKGYDFELCKHLREKHRELIIKFRLENSEGPW